MEYYYDNLSQPCRAVYMLMKLNNIDFIPKDINLAVRQTRTPEYRAINPIGRVPYLKDGDLVLNESNAILKYLAIAKGAADFWYPNDVIKQAKVDEYLAFHQANLRPKCTPYFVSLLMPLIEKSPIDEEAVAKAKEEMIQIIDVFEAYFLTGSDFIAGDDISIADLQAVCELMQVNIGTPVNVEDGRPKMAAWMDRVRAKLAPLFDQTHQKLALAMVGITEPQKPKKRIME